FPDRGLWVHERKFVVADFQLECACAKILRRLVLSALSMLLRRLDHLDIAAKFFVKDLRSVQTFVGSVRVHTRPTSPGDEDCVFRRKFAGAFLVDGIARALVRPKIESGLNG